MSRAFRGRQLSASLLYRAVYFSYCYAAIPAYDPRRRTPFMMTVLTRIVTRLVVAAVILAQAPATLPARIGELGKNLTDSEAVQIARIASPTGPVPWLLYGYRGQIGDVMDVYLPPDSSTKDVRRGDLIYLSRFRGMSPATPSSWGGPRLERYAQVVLAGHDFNQVQSDKDTNRPFETRGEFTDDDLIRIVTLIRTSTVSAGFAGGKIWSDLPINSMIRQSGDNVTVWIPKDPAGEIQRVTLRRSGTEWVVADIANGIA